MNQKISIGNKEIFEDFQEKAGLSNHADSFETVREWPEELGKGFIRKIKLQPGFELIINDFRFQEDHLVSGGVQPSPLQFAFCISGKCKGTVRGIKNNFIIGPEQSYLFFAPELKGTAEYPAGERILSVVIQINPSLFNTFLGGECDRIPGDLRGIIDGSNENNYNRTGSITPSAQMAVHQILNCPYQGLTRRMYLEGKSLEIMALQLIQLVFGENRSVKPPTLRPADVERIHEARDILIRNLENPPSLFGLASQVGLNDTKLKRGFRQVLGTTVFGCLHAHRMEIGRQLLAEGKMNVTEVAYEVGYSSRPYFSRAFTRHFGLNPIVYLRGNCKDISLA